LADDDSRIRIVFRMVLERLGMAVLEAGDGNEAWRKIQEGNVCLAILDMKMPGLHGLEVLGRMADRQLEIPVIVCSAYDQLKDEFIIATHPRLRYLVKPVSSEALEKAVRELVPMPSKP
jgi:DNA-binding NtrC family response regulator